MTNIEDIFASELHKISHKYIREAVVTAFNGSLDASDYWIHAPASASGKNHPPDERGDGGCVLHAKRVFKLCENLAEAFNLSMYEKDLLLASSLVHDLYQHEFWPQPDGSIKYRTDLEHDQVIGNALRRIGGTACDIANVVQYHSGKWGSNNNGRLFIGSLDSLLTKGISRMAFLGILFHIADYIASRREVLIQVGENE